MDLHSRNEAVDLVTVTEELRRLGKLDAIGGTAAITALSNAVPTAANVVYHAKIVEEKSLRRQLINSATEVVASGYEEEQDIAQTIDQAEQKILAVANRKHSGGRGEDQGYREKRHGPDRGIVRHQGCLYRPAHRFPISTK